MNWRDPSRPIGYGRQTLGPEDRAAVLACLEDERLTQGPRVDRFEEELSLSTGAPFVCAVHNGTAALELAFAALDLPRGARVWTSANTFLASATAPLHAGLEVRFLDVEEASGQLDVEELAAHLDAGERVDCVVAVHFAGAPCDLERLLALKAVHGFRLVVDAAHALGATPTLEGREWRLAEHPGVDATTLSFHPVKQITTGEGGALLLHDEALHRRARLFREHGIDRESELAAFDAPGPRQAWFGPMVMLGRNLRLADLNAALGSSQLARLPAFLEARRARAQRYDEALTAWGRPAVVPGHAWHLYVLHAEAEERDELMQALAAGGIGTQLHYYPVPLQPWFRQRLPARSYPRAERHARTALSLPLYPGLDASDQERVIAALGEWRS